MKSRPATNEGPVLSAPAPRLWVQVTRVSRASDWWEHKVPCVLAVVYATAYRHSMSLVDLVPLIAGVMFALVAAATYVSVINDLTDETDDLRAGKANRLAGRSRGVKGMALGLCLALGCVSIWLLRTHPTALWLYLGNWLAFTLYSVRPFRLKYRGIAGVLADASGGQCLPALWATFWVADTVGQPWPAFWLPLALWSLALGLRSILLHQMTDLEEDRIVGGRTLAVRWGPSRIRKLVALGTLPLELTALGFLLHQTGARWAWPLLLMEGGFVWLRYRLDGLRPFVVHPEARGSALLYEYHQVLFPLTFILALAGRDPLALLLIPMHVLLFPRCARRRWDEVWGWSCRILGAIHRRSLAGNRA